MYKLAQAKHRIFAFLFDWAIVYAFSLLIASRTIIAAIKAMLSHADDQILSLTLNALLTGGIILIFVCLYFLVMPVFLNGQTLGKKFFKIRIVRKDLSEVDFTTLFVREVLGKVLVDFFTIGVSLLASGIVLCQNDAHLTFHDVLASTMVIDVE